MENKMDLIKISETNKDEMKDAIDELEDRVVEIEDSFMTEQAALELVERSIGINLRSFREEVYELRKELHKTYSINKKLQEALFVTGEESVMEYLTYQRVNSLINPPGGFKYKEYAVYLVVDSDLNVAKIGYSGNLKQRIRDLFITGEVHYTVYNSKEKAIERESELLFKYKEYIISKEYIKINHDLIDKLKTEFEINYSVKEQIP